MLQVRHTMLQGHPLFVLLLQSRSWGTAELVASTANKIFLFEKHAILVYFLLQIFEKWYFCLVILL